MFLLSLALRPSLLRAVALAFGEQMRAEVAFIALDMKKKGQFVRHFTPDQRATAIVQRATRELASRRRRAPRDLRMIVERMTLR
jgi:hypothetical protein